MQFRKVWNLISNFDIPSFLIIFLNVLSSLCPFFCPSISSPHCVISLNIYLCPSLAVSVPPSLHPYLFLFVSFFILFFSSPPFVLSFSFFFCFLTVFTPSLVKSFLWTPLPFSTFVLSCLYSFSLTHWVLPLLNFFMLFIPSPSLYFFCSSFHLSFLQYNLPNAETWSTKFTKR